MRVISPEWRVLGNAVQREVWAFSDAVPGLPENLRVLIPLDWPPLPLELPEADMGATLAGVPVMRSATVTRPVLGIVLDMAPDALRSGVSLAPPLLH
jgi:hypothetical protein